MTTTNHNSTLGDTSLQDEEMMDASMVPTDHDHIQQQQQPPQQQQQQQQSSNIIHSSSLTTNSISGSPVIQLNLTLGVQPHQQQTHHVHVTRRSSDSFFNATEIITLALLLSSDGSSAVQSPIPVETIQQVLQSAIQEQLTVSDDANTVWIGLDKAVLLAQKLEVYEILKALFFVDVNNKSLSSGSGSLARNYSEINDRHDEYQTQNQHHVTNNGSPLKKVKLGKLESTTTTPFHYENSNKPYTLPPLDCSKVADFEMKRAEITNWFSEDEASLNYRKKDHHYPNTNNLVQGEEVDIGIDAIGNTGLHWACALGRQALVEKFISLGSCVYRGNRHGESAFIRAICVTNAYDNGCFLEILDSLYPCLMLLDNQGRSVLHHLAITAGIKKRVLAVRHYLSTMLEWIVKHGAEKSPELTIGKFIENIVNLKDKSGDTALSIAARIGNTAIVEELLLIRADPSIVNNAGLKAVDFGIKMNSIHSLHFNGHAENVRTSTTPEVQSSSKILESMHSLLNRLDTDFKSEMQERHSKLKALREQMQLKSQELAAVRDTNTKVSEYEARILQLRQRLNNVNKAIGQQEQFFVSSQSNTDLTNLHKIKYDPDEPFRVTTSNNNNNLPSTAYLKARKKAYLTNQQTLNFEIQKLTQQSEDLETKFKKVISLCCQGTKMEDINEELIDGLVRCVEEDSLLMQEEEEQREASVGVAGGGDMERVKGFLKRVEQ